MATYTLPTLNDIQLAYPELDLSMCKIGDKHEPTGTVILTHEQTTRRVPDLGRGTVFAMIDGKVTMVAPTMGFLPEIETTEVSVQKTSSMTDGSLVYVTKIGDRIFDANTLSFEAFSEGFSIRYFRFRGVDFTASHTRLDCSRSKWGQALVSDALEALPSHEEIFGPIEEVPSSSDTVYFNVATCHNITGSRIIYTENGVDPVAVGVYSNGLNLPRARLVPAISIPYADYPLSEDGVVNKVLPLHYPVSLNLFEYYPDTGYTAGILDTEQTVKRVNDFLKFGYYSFSPNDVALPEDPRLLPGEACIARIDGVLYKVVPPSFNWRNEIRNGNPSLLLEFNERIAEKFDTWEDFRQKYFPVALPKFEDLENMIMNGNPYLTVTERTFTRAEKNEYLENPPLMRSLVFANFLFSLPPFQQREAIGFYRDYLRMREVIVDFLHAYAMNKVYFINPDAAKLPTLGSILREIPEYPEDVTNVMKGEDNRLRDVTSIYKEMRLSRDTNLVLVKKLEPHFKRIIDQSREHVEKRLKLKPRGDKYFQAMDDSFRYHLDRTYGKVYHRMSKQASAWGGYHNYPGYLNRSASSVAASSK